MIPPSQLTLSRGDSYWDTFFIYLLAVQFLAVNSIDDVSPANSANSSFIECPKPSTIFSQTSIRKAVNQVIF